MRREEAFDLVASLALDAVDEGERRDLDAYMVIDPILRKEYDEFSAQAAALATAVDPNPSPPPPAVWDAIHETLEGHDAALPGLPPVAKRSRDRTPWWSRIRLGRLVAVAAMLAVFAVGAAAGVTLARSDSPDLASLASASLADPTSSVVTLTGQEGFEDVSVDIVLGVDGTGYVIDNTLPETAADRTYQLWLIIPDTDGGPDPLVVSAGVLGRSPVVAAFTAESDVIGFAVTEEPAGGVEASEGATVALWVAGS